MERATIGSKWGHLTIVEKLDFDKTGHRFVKCLCECGNIVIVRTSQLLSGDSVSCRKCPPTNIYHFIGDVAYGKCTDGTVFIFDRDDYEKIKMNQWHNAKGYICSVKNGKRFNLHRLVAGVTDRSICVDHIDGNKLDCRKSNLRNATKGQNNWNRNCVFSGKTKYRGVDVHTQNKNYRARIGYKNNHIHLGCYITAHEAAYARNVASRILHGTYKGKINDIDYVNEEIEKRIIQRCSKYLMRCE